MSGGRTQLGPHQIRGLLGAGGMGAVYRAHDPRLRRDVAIKLLSPARITDPDAIARMEREARTIAALAHPNIVTVHDVGTQDGEFYLVTELVEGETLRVHMRSGPMAPRVVLDYAVSISSALAAAHDRSVIHRDLKPENIMITPGGGVKVLDFGVAKSFATADAATEVPATMLTEPGQAVGTPAYMAPEQLEGRALDHRADQFALGVMLFEMLSGRRPFKGTTVPEITASILRDDPAHLSAIAQGVPASLSRIVGRCLAKRQNERYASTTDLAHVIADARADLDAGTTPVAVPVARTRAPQWIAAVVIVAVVGLIAAMRYGGAPPAPADVSGTGPRAVAVLPFTTIGAVEPYLADGVTEAVTRELAHIEGMRVIASSSAFAYRGRNEGFREIAGELGVAMMVAARFSASAIVCASSPA